MRKFRTAFANLCLLNMIGSAAAASTNLPHPDWNSLGFRLASDTLPEPLSAFILSLDPKIFKNPSDISNAIIETCTNLATTPVDDWDNQSFYFESIKDLPGSVFRTQAEVYTTFENYHVGTLPSDSTLSCITDVLKPYFHTKPVVDWDGGYQFLFAAGLILATACVAGSLYCCCKSASNTSSTETQRLFNSTKYLEAGYGTKTAPNTLPPSYKSIQEPSPSLRRT